MAFAFTRQQRQRGATPRCDAVALKIHDNPIITMKLTDLQPQLLDEVYIVQADLVTGERLLEGKIVSGRFSSSLRIDPATHLHGAVPPHAHVFGRKGDELGVVNMDGTPSHGSKFKLHPKDADALRARGFTIRPDNLVEWTASASVDGVRFVLFG